VIGGCERKDSAKGGNAYVKEYEVERMWAGRRFQSGRKDHHPSDVQCRDSHRAYGIWLSSPYFAAAYLAYTLGSFTLLMRYTVCARCPHLLTAGDCLFLPPSLAKKLVSTKHAGPLLPWERAIFFGAFLGAALFPVWFLLQEPALLGAFIVLMGGSFLGLLLHFCKECHTTVCPLNKRRAGGCKNALN